MDCGRLDLKPPQALEERRDSRRDRGLRVGAENQAAEGDANLRGGNIAVERVRVFDNGQDPRGESVAVLGKPPQPASARAHDGEFRRHEQRRQQDQQGDDP